MSTDQIRDLLKQVQQAFAEAEAISQECDLLRRVLRQAVLANGGELKIDPKFADAAVKETRLLFIGCGGVSLL